MNQIEPIVIDAEEREALKQETRDIISRAEEEMKDPRGAVLEVTHFVVNLISSQLLYPVGEGKVAVNKEEALEMLYRLDMSLDITNEVLYIEHGIDPIKHEEIDSTFIQGILDAEGLDYQGVLDKYRTILFGEGEVH